MSQGTDNRSLRGHQAVTLTLLFLAGVVNFFDRASLAVANNTVRADMHLSGTQMGWLLSAFAIAYAAAQIPLIFTMDRLGTRTVLGVGLAVWSTAQLLTGFVRSFSTFIYCRILLGAGESPFYPAGVRSVREWFSAQTRGRATALMSSSQTFGLAMAPPVLTLLMIRYGWRTMFVILGAAGLLVSVLWVVLHRPRGATRHSSVEFVPSTEGMGAMFRQLVTRRMSWGMMIGFSGINYTNWLYTTWLPGYLQTARHLSLAKSGWLAAIPFLAGAFGMLSSGFLADFWAKRFPLVKVHRAQIIAGMLVSAAGTFFVSRSGSTAAAVAGISVAYFCIHFAGTSGWGYTQAVSRPQQVAAMTALQNFFASLVASIAPVLTGFLLDKTQNFTLALVVCSGFAVMGAVSYATLAAPSREVVVG